MKLYKENSYIIEKSPTNKKFYVSDSGCGCCGTYQEFDELLEDDYFYLLENLRSQVKIVEDKLKGLGFNV